MPSWIAKLPNCWRNLVEAEIVAMPSRFFVCVGANGSERMWDDPATRHQKQILRLMWYSFFSLKCFVEVQRGSELKDLQGYGNCRNSMHSEGLVELCTFTTIRPPFWTDDMKEGAGKGTSWYKRNDINAFQSHLSYTVIPVLVVFGAHLLYCCWLCAFWFKRVSS